MDSSCACPLRLPPQAESRRGCFLLQITPPTNLVQPVAAWSHLPQTWLWVHPGCPRACRAGGEGQLPGSDAGLQKESGSPLAWLTSS